jgi:hypothetical protein
MTCRHSSSKAPRAMIDRHLRREPDSYIERQAHIPRDRYAQREVDTYSEGQASTKKLRRTFGKRLEQGNKVYNYGDPVAIGNLLVAEGRVSHR